MAQSTTSTAARLVPLPSDLTPAMRQYAEQKHRVGDAILLFRMGDFYETFWDDAVLCSRVLGIALTSRNKDSDDPVPLAGIPYHALESYLGKLVTAGYKVAISEQLEDPKLAKGVVKRDVVRVVTAGTLTDEGLLAERDDNTLAALCIRGGQAGVALVELASGRFEVLDLESDAVVDELTRARPAELIIHDERDAVHEQPAARLRESCGTCTTRRPQHEFSAFQAEKSLLEHFGVATLAGFGFDAVSPGLCSAGCVLEYLRETQKTTLGHITAIRRRTLDQYVQIDHATWRSLEIDRTLRSQLTEGTLLWAIDRTVHPGGGRLLRQWLRLPLTQADAIRQRQQAVAALVDDDIRRARLRKRLRNLSDIERIVARVALARCSPRDLNALGNSLAQLPSIADDLKGDPHPLLGQIAVDLCGLEELSDLLRRAIRDDPSNALREGGFIADGYQVELDRLRAIGHDGQQWLADYQRREIQRTGIANLKAGFNRVFGYYLEIPNTSRDKAPPDYVRKQTIKNAERYITDELKRYEEEVLTAAERANELEFRLFEELREKVASWIQPLLRAAEAIARLDVIAALAELAVERRYIRPQIVDDGLFTIVDGRHPVLDRTLGDAFVPNDTLLGGDDACVLIITGPNMAGKSTYIRQVALLTILAQVGSFVPAKDMRWSLVDRVFARVGSTDEIMRGQSTFMVEMTEAANILHNATDRSLVVLDELGRGTSTFDGLSLAWAITEHLANVTRCRTLVATHYHELIELASLLKNVRNCNVAVKEYPAAKDREEAIVFLHRIVGGGASRSYGIHVAGLAGIPPSVINRSRQVLDELQRGFARESRNPGLAARKNREECQLPLFHEPGEEFLEELAKVDPDQMTPIEALQILKHWRKQYGR